MARFNEDLRLSYVETTLWANTYAQNGDGEIRMLSETTLDGLVDICDVETMLPTYADDVETFYSECWDSVAEKYGEDSDEFEAFQDITAESFAHDFALTRNRHGAGFWDRGYGELGDFLSDLARIWGEASLEVWVDADGEPCVAAV